MARGRGIPVLLVEPVLAELEQQFVERVEKANEAMRQASDTVTQLGFDYSPPLLNAADELARYRDQVDAISRELVIARVPATTAAASELFVHAVERRAPFHRAGKAKDAGFKDAVIQRSICDDVQRRGIPRAVLVSADSDHATAADFHPAVPTLRKRTLEQALTALRMAGATVNQVAAWQQRLTLANDWIQGHQEALRLYVRDHFSANYAALPNTHGTVVGVVDAELLVVQAVDIYPTLGDAAAGEEVELTIYVGVALTVAVQSPSPAELPADASAMERLVSELVARQTTTALLPALVEVDALVKRTPDGYADLRLVSARLTSDAEAVAAATHQRRQRLFGTTV
jgi:hypothetical protein